MMWGIVEVKKACPLFFFLYSSKHLKLRVHTVLFSNCGLDLTQHDTCWIWRHGWVSSMLWASLSSLPGCLSLVHSGFKYRCSEMRRLYRRSFSLLFALTNFGILPLQECVAGGQPWAWAVYPHFSFSLWTSGMGRQEKRSTYNLKNKAYGDVKRRTTFSIQEKVSADDSLEYSSFCQTKPLSASSVACSWLLLHIFSIFFPVLKLKFIHVVDQLRV